MMNSTKAVVFIGKKKMQCHSSVYAEDATRKEKNNKKKMLRHHFSIRIRGKKMGEALVLASYMRKERKGKEYMC